MDIIYQVPEGIFRPFKALKSFCYYIEGGGGGGGGDIIIFEYF